MAKEVFKGAVVTLNSVDVSALVESVEIELNRAAERATGLTDEAEVEMVGLKNNAVSMTLYNTFGTSEIFQTLRTLYANGTTFAWSLRKASGSVAVDNPEFSGSAFLKDWQAIGGEVGSRHMTQVTLGLTTDVTVATS